MFFWSASVTGGLRGALLFSVAVHFLILSVGDRLADSATVESGIAAKNLRVVALSARRVGTGSLQPASGMTGGARSPRLPVDSTQPLLAAEKAPVPAVNVAMQEFPAAFSPTATPAAAVSAPQEAIDSKSAPVTKPGVAVSDGYADAVRGYRIALALQAKRFRIYPPQAEEMGLGGRSEIEVVVPPTARPELRVKQSSGHRELDQAALEMLRRSVASVELPPLLKGEQFSFSLPVDFLPAH